MKDSPKKKSRIRGRGLSIANIFQAIGEGFRCRWPNFYFKKLKFFF